MIDRKHRYFSDDDIRRLAETFGAFQAGTLESVKGFCAVAGIEEISAQGYILTPGRYVGIEEGDEEVEPFGEKMMRLAGELGGMFEESRVIEEEIRLRLGGIGYGV